MYLFAYGNVYFSMFLSICPALAFPYCVSKSLLYVCISIAALKKGSSVLSFWIPYDVLMHNIYLSLSNLLHSVKQALGPSTSLRLTQMHSLFFFIAE